MASDEDYMAFLDKANRDPSEGYAKTASTDKAEFKTTDEGVQVPAALKKAVQGAVYVTDADEEFVPVALKFNGDKLPDEEEFAKLIHHPDPGKAQVEILDPIDWDREGQYKDLLDAAREAGKGNDVRVYRVAKGGPRSEYWLVTRDGKGALVGAKALGVES